MMKLKCLAGNPDILKEMLIMLKKVTWTEIKIGSFFSLLPRFYTSQEGAGFLNHQQYMYSNLFMFHVDWQLCLFL